MNFARFYSKRFANRFAMVCLRAGRLNVWIETPSHAATHGRAYFVHWTSVLIALSLAALLAGCTYEAAPSPAPRRAEMQEYTLTTDIEIPASSWIRSQDAYCTPGDFAVSGGCGVVLNHVPYPHDDPQAGVTVLESVTTVVGHTCNVLSQQEDATLYTWATCEKGSDK